jgi:hypothetical protein
LEIVQLWRCASCKRTFTPGPQAVRGKTYPLRTVLEALSTYSLGYSLEDKAARVKSRSGRRIGSSTMAGWIAQHKPLMSYLRLRHRGRAPLPCRAGRSVDQALPSADLWLRLPPAEAGVSAPG